MKGKFSSVWRVATALVLALSLALVVAAPASATISQPTVTIKAGEADTSLADADYTITFVSTSALSTADTITITFPSNTVVTTGSIAGTVEGTSIASWAVSGRRLSITVPAAITAGTTVDVVLTAGITNPSTSGTTYTLTVYTSQEPTTVTSETYTIGNDVVGALTVAIDPTTVDTAAEYIITFTSVTTLVADTDTIVITFPEDTTVPATIPKANVSVKDDSGSYVTSEAEPTVVGRTVTVTVPDAIAGGSVIMVRFVVTAVIKNPTEIASDWTVTIYTSKDIAPVTSGTYSTTAAAAAAITQLVIKDVDSYIPNDTKSSQMTVEAQDQYGNATPVSGSNVISLSATPSGGNFYINGTPVASVTITNGNSSTTFKFLGTTAGTYTITASKTDWTSGTASVLVNPKLELWGGGELKASYTTFALAIDAALPYDTIKVAASTYDEQLRFESSNSYLTIESTAGRDSTTLYNNGYFILELVAATNITIDGFTFKGTAYTGGDQRGIFVRGGSDDFTIKNSKFIDLYSDAIMVSGESGSITGGTITNNIVTGMGLDARLYRGGIWVETYGNAISGISITNNTISGYGGTTIDSQAILLARTSADMTDMTVTGNTISTSYTGIGLVGSMTGMTGTKAIANNSITGGYRGIAIVAQGSNAAEHELSVVKNTITSNTYGIHLPNSGNGTIAGVTMKIMYNDISGNGVGIHNGFTTVTNAPIATHNYWGDPTGPETDANPSGAGDTITTTVADGVTYSPWLAVSQATCVPLKTSQYAISILLSNYATYDGTSYSGGWNTFSTPIWLDSTGDTWGEILTAANATAQVANVLGWDGKVWTSVVSATVINPLDAIFVQLKTAQSLPIIYDSNQSPRVANTKTMHAATGLYTGWEFIGLANLSNKTLTDTLASISDKYSQVIDPITGDVDQTTLVVGSGYWVFMTADSTLAGFSVTPVPWIDVP